MKLFPFSVAALAMALSACSNHFAQLEDINDLFRPTTSGTAVRVVTNAPNPYLETAQNSQSKKNKKGKKGKMQAEYHTQPVVQTTKTETRRINTTQCNDSDDWYLDGYRVGRSFNAQRSQMLQQRMSFCHFSQLPSQLAANWERGFAIGSQESGANRKNRKTRT